jgi:hypothetical protein
MNNILLGIAIAMVAAVNYTTFMPPPKCPSTTAAEKQIALLATGLAERDKVIHELYVSAIEDARQAKKELEDAKKKLACH